MRDHPLQCTPILPGLWGVRIKESQSKEFLNVTQEIFKMSLTLAKDRKCHHKDRKTLRVKIEIFDTC